jgi:NRPS condensation-like uncharacterized protein
MQEQFPKSSPVSGADWFMLAMDPHMTRFNTVGNICRYVLFLNGRLDEKKLREKIEDKKVVQWLAGLAIKKNGPLSLPEWIAGTHAPAIRFEIHSCENDDIPQSIMERDIPVNNGPLFQIDLIYRPGNKTTFIYSWHHILMDGRGAGLLIKYLNGDESIVDPERLIPKSASAEPLWKKWNNMMVTKNFLKESSRKPLATFYKNATVDIPSAKYSIVRFSIDETTQINKNAQKQGSRFGLSPFYLAAATRAVHRILEKRGAGNNPYWIPVPQDERLRGATGPFITNQLSFIFYRLPVNCLQTLKGAVNEINNQMVEQIKTGMPKNYAAMMSWFRMLPLKPYYSLIKGPAGGSIASFLFSVASDSHDELKTFLDHEVADAINFPPNTYPPGLTIVFMRFNGTLKIIINFVEQSITSSEIEIFKSLVRKDLMEGDESP